MYAYSHREESAHICRDSLSPHGFCGTRAPPIFWQAFSDFVDSGALEGHNIDNDAAAVVEASTDEGWDDTIGKFRNILDQIVTVTFSGNGELDSVTMFKPGSTNTQVSTIVEAGDEGVVTIDLPGIDSAAATALDT